MIKNVLRFIFFQIFKKYLTNKIPVFGIVLLLLMSSLSIASHQNPNANEDEGRAIIWDVTLNFNEPGLAYDYTVFGEAPDANDGPPADVYDTAKPPAPIPSYIRAYFNDNIPYPYNNLWKDYRHYPAVTKTWNLSVQWVPADSVSPTTITISWSPSEINNTEYVSIMLCSSGGVPLQNMRTANSYSFICPAFIPFSYKIICIANLPPNSPGNPSPSQGAVGVPVNADLGWTCSDPNGDPLTYDVYFGTSSTPPKVASNISLATYDPGPMNPTTQYYWKIIAWDIYSVSTAGPTWYFQTNSLPNQPSNPTPSNGSTGISPNALLSWTCSDPNGDPLTYDVYFGTSSTPPKVASNISTMNYYPTMTYGTLYYWKIVAWDLNSGSRAGPIWHFKTNSVPNQPSNPTPTNGSTGVPINPDLSWTGGDPDPGDTVTYDVYFGTSSTPPKVASNISVTTYKPATLLYNTNYYWKIISWDNHGVSTVGPRWQFRTTSQTNQPPYTPSNPNPVNGATEISINTGLSWTGGDPDSGDYVTYDVYFDTVNPPLIKIKSNISGTTCTIGNLNYSQKYYWKVVAWDNHHNTNAGPVWSFTTKRDTSGPSLAITSPRRGWVYIHLLGGLIDRHLPILLSTIVIGPIYVNVTASDSESGMDRVEFYLDDDLKFTDYEAPYQWYWNESGLIFPYQLKVTAYDKLDNPSTLSIRVWKIF